MKVIVNIRTKGKTTMQNKRTLTRHRRQPVLTKPLQEQAERIVDDIRAKTRDVMASRRATSLDNLMNQKPVDEIWNRWSMKLLHELFGDDIRDGEKILRELVAINYKTELAKEELREVQNDLNDLQERARKLTARMQKLFTDHY